MKRQMERNKACVCKNCGKTFEAVRYNAETCSDKCRKAYSRWMNDILPHLNVIIEHLEALKGYRLTEGDGQARKAVETVMHRSKGLYDLWE